MPNDTPFISWHICEGGCERAGLPVLLTKSTPHTLDRQHNPFSTHIFQENLWADGEVLDDGWGPGCCVGEWVVLSQPRLAEQPLWAKFL